MTDNQNNQRLYGMLGLAMRAGKVIVGTEQVCIGLSKGKIHLVLISTEASEGTKKKIGFKCEFYNIRSLEVNICTEELGRLLGKTYGPAAVGIADENFANTISSIITGSRTA